MKLRRFAATAFGLAAGACVFAQSALPPVTVTAPLRDPVEKSYRKMIRGMDVFEQLMPRIAPGATLRFKLLPRKRDTDMSSIDLYIVSTSVDQALPIAADQTFTLPRIAKALQEDAVVTPNRKKQTMTWRTEIRSPGLPPQVRRLGDMRLECRVGMEAELVSGADNVLSKFARLFSDPVAYCGKKEARYLFFAERPLFSVTLVAGNRREVLPVDRLYAEATDDPGLKEDLPFCDCEVLLDRTYFLPLGDASWPDDTRIEFEFMEDGDAPPAR